MAPRATAKRALSRLTRGLREYGAGHGLAKRELLERLEHATLESPRAVRDLHEALCFLRAYPDDRMLLATVERLLGAFASRRDVRRFREQLADTAIAGTPIYFSYHWVTARWLAATWPAYLHVDWARFDTSLLERIAHLLVPYAEAVDLDALGMSPQDWLARIKGADETDATFLIRRVDAMPADEATRETLYGLLDVPLRLDPGPGTPSRTRAKYRWPRVSYQTAPLRHGRPRLADAVELPPRSVRSLSRKEGGRVITLAREAMATRSRDLDAIMYASEDDVRIVDAGDGLAFACIGLRPEYRAMIETIYVFIMLQNGVPIGYYQSALLFGSAELNYHVFKPFRGAESAHVYARGLAMVHALFGCDAFAIDPYQLGHENADALRSGAFWFYQKLGFEPEGAAVRRVLARELAAMKRDPAHRSSPEALAALAREYVFFYLGKRRADVAGKVNLGAIALATSSYVAKRFGADRARAAATCSAEAAALLGVDPRRLRAAERLAWERWAPLCTALPGVQRFSAEEKRALGELVIAKAARREEDFAARLDRHVALRRALVALATRPGAAGRRRA